MPSKQLSQTLPSNHRPLQPPPPTAPSTPHHTTLSPPHTPQNVEFLEGYGSFLAEAGDRSEAVAVLQRAAAAQPDEGFEKFM